MKRHLILLVSTLALLGSSAFAQTTKVPALINYQGNVRSATGTPLSATRTVTFRFYKSPTSALAADRLWSESQSVTIVDGNFSVLIGGGAAVNNEANTGTFAEVFGKSTSVYLSITVDDGTSATDPEISPRQQLVTTAFAFRATVAEKVDDAAVTGPMIAANAVTTTQLNASAVTAEKIATSAVTSTQILDGTIATADIADSSITTVDIADNSITTAKIVDGAIATADMADSAITTAKIASGVNLSAGTLSATGNAAIAGNATIGLVGGTATLKVNDKPVPVGEESLRIIRGSVNADGTIALGSGFNIQGATPGFAAWQVNFTPPFSATPTVLVSDYLSTDGYHAVVVGSEPATANSFRCYYTMFNNNPTRRGFSFIAIGPR